MQPIFSIQNKADISKAYKYMWAKKAWNLIESCIKKFIAYEAETGLYWNNFRIENNQEFHNDPQIIKKEKTLL